MAFSGRDVDGPMTGTADVAGAALLDRLKGADLVAELMALPGARIHGLAEFIIEPFIAEIAFLFGDPFLQPEVRCDDEFAHGFLRDLIRFSKRHRASPHCGRIGWYVAHGSS